MHKYDNDNSEHGDQDFFIHGFLLDDFIRPRQHLRRNRHADLLGGFEIDSKLKLHRLLYGQVSGFSAFEYLIHIHRRAPEVVVRIWPITHEASSFDMYDSWINRWQPILC